MKIIQSLILILFVSLLLINCGGNKSEQKTSFVHPITVEIVAVERGDIEITKIYGGTVEGIEQSDIYARIPEAVMKVNAKLGEKVNKDDVLIVLDREGPNSHYLQAKSAYENASKNYSRMKYLFEQKAISEQSFDQVKTAYEVAQANFEAAASLVELKSPIDGVITFISVTLGQYTVPGKPLITVAKTDSIKIRLALNVRDAGRLSLGSEATIFADKSRDSRIKGRISRISSSADPNTRGFEVEIVALNSENILKPGTFVDVGLILDRYNDVLLIPSDAIFLKSGEKYVYKDSSGRAVLTRIEVGGESNNKAYIKSGLKEGDVVVAMGSNLLVNGDSLKIVSE